MVAKKETYVITFLLTTMVFIVGIVIGSEITRNSMENVQKMLQKDIMETQSLDLEMSMVERLGGKDAVCKYIETRLPNFIKEKTELGRKLDIGDISEDDAKMIETQFVLSLTKFLLFSNMQEEYCNIKKPKILYFLDMSEESREQSMVLDYVVYRLSEENITVFTFSKKLEDQHLVKLMENMYNITTFPSIVLDGEKYEGFQSKENVMKIICSKYKFSACTKS